MRNDPGQPRLRESRTSTSSDDRATSTRGKSSAPLGELPRVVAQIRSLHDRQPIDAHIDRPHAVPRLNGGVSWAEGQWGMAMGLINDARLHGPQDLKAYLKSLNEAFDVLMALALAPCNVKAGEIELRFEQIFKMSLEPFVRFNRDHSRDPAVADELLELPMKLAEQAAGPDRYRKQGTIIAALTDISARLPDQASHAGFRARIHELRGRLWSELLKRYEADRRFNEQLDCDQSTRSSSELSETLCNCIAVLMGLFFLPHTVDCMRQATAIPEARERLKHLLTETPFIVDEDEPLIVAFARGLDLLASPR
jgi:hypothetical protein